MKKSKVMRQAKILELIRNNVVKTQEQLMETLLELGYTATQATVSRDIRELKIVKISDKIGDFRYASSTDVSGDAASGRFKNVFLEAVRKVTFINNLVVIKTYSGMGSAVGATLDMLYTDKMVATIAGDDTVLVITRNNSQAEALADELDEQIK